MKRLFSIILALCMVCALTACGSEASQNESGVSESPSAAQSAESMESMEGESTENSVASEDIEENETSEPTETGNGILVAFFSRADENYGVGVIEKGNTQIIAEMIAEETGGELFHIERDTPYPAGYDECTEEAKREQDDNARPALKEDIDISGYDTIYLGYPNWWGDMPMPVYTFLEAHDWNGKTIIPFCTHAGSGLAATENSIADTCDGATLLDGFAIAGTTAQNEQDEARTAVLEWLETIGE